MVRFRKDVLAVCSFGKLVVTLTRRGAIHVLRQNWLQSKCSMRRVDCLILWCGQDGYSECEGAEVVPTG